MAYQTVGCLDYPLRATVILFKLEQLRTFELFCKIKYVVNVCSTESINALGVVTDSTNVQMLL